jgi:hypothetical protein
MAKELQFIGDTTQTGLTVTAKVYDSDGTKIGSDVSCPEIGSTAIYIGNMVSTNSGEYTVRFYSDSIVVAYGTILWDGTKEVNLLTLKTEITQEHVAIDTHILAIQLDVDGIITSISQLLLSGVNIDFIKNVLEGDVVPTETVFSILHKDSKAVLVQKNASHTESFTQLTE